ncbi:hypothetical protein BT96DRAFT_987252 [Gymnopus androsaceus JB14]|uniref:DUF6533 domain-containing protein n=1 Tax=Gymnopus androsaceus JB14 TaxID=1447944 RepID=A0A6A4IBN5_9AGAR|nr:hypothetical protein BT96DRAFT_987252 [Gymnopus androsaceus JB14]
MAMDTITNILVDSQIVAYSKVAMLTLLSYDYFLSFAQEVLDLHRSPTFGPANWGFVEALYFISRYSPFIDTILVVEALRSCNRVMTFNTIFSGMGIGISDLILIIRTYSIYSRSRKVLAVLIISWVAVAAANIAAVINWTKIDPTLITPETPSCFLFSESKMGLINFISLLAGETVVVALTLWKTLRDYLELGYPGTSQKVAITFFRDGVLFYLFILRNVLMLIYAPVELQGILDTPLRVMHSILCCRLVIHVRAVADYKVEELECLDDLVFPVNSKKPDV